MSEEPVISFNVPPESKRRRVVAQVPMGPWTMLPRSVVADGWRIARPTEVPPVDIKHRIVGYFASLLGGYRTQDLSTDCCVRLRRIEGERLKYEGANPSVSKMYFDYDNMIIFYADGQTPYAGYVCLELLFSICCLSLEV